VSILQVPGAGEIAVELHSLSKTYNMAGFRVGMLVGNEGLIDAVGRLKSNVDSGMFRPIQYAAIEALQLPESWIYERNAIYKRRRDVLVEGCNGLGMHAELPEAGLYVWVRVPEDFTAREFAHWLFEKVGVYVTAGSDFGAMGEGFVRLAITAPEERLVTAMQRIGGVLRQR
jgi:LL-diaminopimelate aminotransferase